MMRVTAGVLAAAVGVCAWASAGGAQVVRYDGDVVVRTHPSSEAEVEFLEQLSEDRWSHEPDESHGVDYRLARSELGLLSAAGIEYEVLIADLQGAIDAERASLAEGVPAGGTWFQQYKTYDQYSAYIDELVAARPDLAQRLELGNSLQGRGIPALRITGPGGGTKPAILLVSLQHAREWVSGMSSMYMADSLIRDYATDARVRALVDRVEWLIVPIMNPDGYVYSWTNDRLWRKNRRGGYGVDLNRNWGFQWGGAGSSGSQNDDLYRGTAPFSEPETQRIRDFTIARPNIVAAFDFHSYSQLVLYPWGYTNSLPQDNAQYSALSQGMVTAIRGVNNQRYTYGPVYRTLYPASGVSIDWWYGAEDILAWTIEMRDQGQYGFVLPANQIIPNAAENWEAIKYLMEQLVPACPGDWNGSGTVDSDDFFDFLNDYNTGNADFNGDGVTDSDDFFDFLNAYNTPC